VRNATNPGYTFTCAGGLAGLDLQASELQRQLQGAGTSAQNSLQIKACKLQNYRGSYRGAGATPKIGTTFDPQPAGQRKRKYSCG